MPAADDDRRGTRLGDHPIASRLDSGPQGFDRGGPAGSERINPKNSSGSRAGFTAACAAAVLQIMSHQITKDQPDVPRPVPNGEQPRAAGTSGLYNKDSTP